MSELIKKFSDGSMLEYDKGKFDGWCVYLKRPGKDRIAPRDDQYFTVAVQLGQKYSNEFVYDDFVQLYSHVRAEKTLSASGHQLIGSFLERYEEADVIRFDILYTILYAAMVAEERKENTRLGAKIKRLGVHQILMDTPPLSVEVAAKFSYGMRWQQIDAECKKRGF